VSKNRGGALHQIGSPTISSLIYSWRAQQPRAFKTHILRSFKKPLSRPGGLRRYKRKHAVRPRRPQRPRDGRISVRLHASSPSHAHPEQISINRTEADLTTIVGWANSSAQPSPPTAATLRSTTSTASSPRKTSLRLVRSWVLRRQSSKQT
jgi:hypothetical protein